MMTLDIEQDVNERLLGEGDDPVDTPRYMTMTRRLSFHKKGLVLVTIVLMTLLIGTAWSNTPQMDGIGPMMSTNAMEEDNKPMFSKFVQRLGELENAKKDSSSSSNSTSESHN